MNGVFITFEGGEGSGKSTAINLVKELLEHDGYKVALSREPGGVPVSEQIREVILNVNNKMSSETEALLYAASRVEHLKAKVIPLVNEGYVVLCDRYIDSSLAYQGYARGLGFDAILKANAFALDYLPDLTILIDLEPEIALKRLANKDRESKKDRLDSEGIEFHQKVYDGYHEVIKMYKKRIIVVDGNKTLDALQNECLNIVLKYLGK